jgi:ligand-binding sensor domain-containing protein
VLDADIIRGVAAFPDGSVWASGEHMIASQPRPGAEWVLQGNSETNIGADIGSLVQDGSGRVWVGAYNGGVSVFDKAGWRSLQ